MKGTEMDAKKFKNDFIKDTIRCCEILRMLFPPAFWVSLNSIAAFTQDMLNEAAKAVTQRDEPESAGKPLTDSRAAAPFLLRAAELPNLRENIQNYATENVSEETMTYCENEVMRIFEKSIDLVISTDRDLDEYACIGTIAFALAEQLDNVTCAVAGRKPSDKKRQPHVDIISRELREVFPGSLHKIDVSELDQEIQLMNDYLESCRTEYKYRTKNGK